MPRLEVMRLGYVVKRYPRFSETFIVNEILAHEAAGCEVDIFSLYPPVDSHFQNAIAQVRSPVRYVTAEGLKAAELWSALEEAASTLPGFWRGLDAASGESPASVYQAARVACHARRAGIQHLHAHFATVAASVARLAAHFARIRFSITAHAKDIYHESVSADRLNNLFRAAAAVVTVSDFNRAHLQETYHLPDARLHRIYNGLDLAQLSFQSPVRRPAQILAVGRLVEKKGFVHLIDSCALLAHRGTVFTCRIVGAGPLEHELRARVERLGLAGRVELMGPRVQSDVYGLMRSAALCVAPCVVGEDGDRDGIPTVLLEAMALGTPCIATDITGVPEVVRHEETGLLVPQRQPSALADAMDRLLSDAPLRVDLARRARALMEREFDSTRSAESLRALFEAAVDHRGRARRPLREPSLAASVLQ